MLVDAAKQGWNGGNGIAILQQDIMIERFARPNYYTSEDFELSFACRMEKDELIWAQIRRKITLEECLKISKEITPVF